MQIDVDAVVDTAAMPTSKHKGPIDVEPDIESGTNDTALHWPLIPFPKDWYASS